MGTPAADRCDDHVRSIQRFHMGAKWADIAYNFVVCPHGSVFEGRGWGVRSAANGTAAANDAFHAICYLGGEGDPFTPEARAAIVEMVAEGRRRWPGGQAVRPHSSFKATACPGDVIRDWLGTDPFAAPPAPAGPAVVPGPVYEDSSMQPHFVSLHANGARLDGNGNGYWDLPAFAFDNVVTVNPNVANPPEAGGYNVPDVGWLRWAPGIRVVVEEAVAGGGLDVVVWTAGG